MTVQLNAMIATVGKNKLTSAALGTTLHEPKNAVPERKKENRQTFTNIRFEESGRLQRAVVHPKTGRKW